MGDACPLPVVKTLKALKQLDGEGTVVTSVDNEAAVKNISKMAQEKGCTALVEKVSDAEWHVTVATSGAVAVADPEQDGAVFCDASAGKGKLVISVYTDCMGRGDDELGHKLMKAFIFAVTQQEELPATMLFYNGGAKLTVEGSPVLDDLKGLAEQGVEILTCGTCLDHYGIKDQLAVGEVTNMYVIVEKMEQAVRARRLSSRFPPRRPPWVASPCASSAAFPGERFPCPGRSLPAAVWRGRRCLPMRSCCAPSLPQRVFPPRALR